MNCQQARRCLSPYLDSELDPTATFAISEHLRVCEACRRRFEAEREVESKIVYGLRAGNMPEGMWRDIIQPLRKPRWIGWRLAMPLAAAAAVMLVIWAGWPSRSAPSQPHWLVSEFLSETGGGKPFSSSNAVTVQAGMTMPLKPYSDLALNFAGEAARQHVAQFVRMDTVLDERGAEYVEVRLNCCGEPVIIRVAQRERAGRLQEFVGDGEHVLAAATEGGVVVGQREIGDYVVVAVSRHPVSDLLSSVHLQ